MPSSSSTDGKPKAAWELRMAAMSNRGDSTDDDHEEKRKSLRDEAEAMRRRLASMDGKSTPTSSPRTPRKKSTPSKSKSVFMKKDEPSSPLISPPLRTPRKKTPSKSKSLPAVASPAASKGAKASSGHDVETLKKKLAKVEKLLAKETPGSKDHKKLLKKKKEYQGDIEKLENDESHHNHDDSMSKNDYSSSSITGSRNDDRHKEMEEQERKEKIRAEARRVREEAERAATAAKHEAAEKEKEELAKAEAAEAEERKRQEKEDRREKERIRKQQEKEAEEAVAATAAAAAEQKRLREEEEAAEAAAAEEAAREEVEAEQRRKEAAEAAKAEEERRRQQEQQERNEVVDDEEAEEEWDVVRVIPTDEENITCRTEDCCEQAVVVWASSLDPADEWPVCEDCQLEDFGGWPEGVFPIHKSGDTGDDSEEIARLLAEREEERRLEEIREEEERKRREQEENERRAERERRAAERAEAEAAKALKEKEEPSQEFLDRRSIPQPYSDNTKKILKELENLETRHKKLEKSLTQNGIPITEDISYEAAKDKIAEITESMKQLATSDMDPYKMEKQYFVLEEQLSKYSTALMLTDEYAEEQKRNEQEWEESIEEGNIAALRKLRAHMPVNVRNLTEEELSTTPSPNGKTLPKPFARKFKRTNVLQLVRVNPDDIERMHPSLLEGIRTTGLTLTERRALHHHLRDVASRWEEKQSDPSCEKKWQWFQGLKMKFKEMMNAYTACVEKWGPPGEHRYASRNDPSAGGCPLIGNQCPLKADSVMDYSDDYGYPQEAEYEGVSSAASSGTPSKRSSTNASAKSSKPKISEAELTDQLRERLRLDAYESEVDKKLLRELFHAEKKAISLEKQLTQNGLALPQEDISYSFAKTKIEEITEEIKKVAASMGSTSDAKEITKLETEFGKLSQELDKYNNAMMLTKEWAKEQEDKERQWEMNVSPGNYACLQQIWRHMPVNIKDLSEVDLTCQPTPSGKMLPKPMAKKFKRTNILMLLRTDPASIEPMHPSSIEAMRSTGLTLTERRALHEHLKDIAPKWKSMAKDKMSERKWMWHESLKSKLKEVLEKYEKHVAEYGPPGNHPSAKRDDPGAGGCPLIGNQCPLKADLATDYTGDYGFPDQAQYETQAVAKSNLLSMEDIERRKREDEMEFDGYDPVDSTSTDTQSSNAPRPPAAGGMLAGIKKPPVVESEPAAVPPRPAMGGLMAEIGSKKTPADSDDAPPARPKGGPMGGLLAAIRKR
eukprot:CAMPEP_0113513062 /NCGR_PEP_ID=MMETSP0014_2-20120614/39658_1 /TAXON_ID=2857 /ORGANISM="Nitzschia sp." /LENGTH=1242 /DNA_ID=CAMNT_0000409433 /DNA_START=167 /DNA_END=3895 /DNA_ORIENTATION=+ /assembly_acc=CAM_ASM_000159